MYRGGRQIMLKLSFLAVLLFVNKIMAEVAKCLEYQKVIKPVGNNLTQSYMTVMLKKSAPVQYKCTALCVWGTELK